ncbi:MAG: hypothetical protein JSU06_01445 [Actinobacteria bacterium]|nr:hypothetical protein [Actinomycetota bacterium]
MPPSLETCPGCGIALPVETGPTHPYMRGSAACWRGYGALLAAQYQDPRRMRFHQIVVDAYAAQHPDGDDPRAIRSVAIHLMTLALFLERDVDPAEGTRLHRRMVERPVFRRLRRPDAGRPRTLSFVHVPLDGDPAVARDRAYEWGRSVWAAWGPEQDVVRGWLETSGMA